MSETLHESIKPEQRVFGDAYSFRSGRARDELVKSFFESRIESIREGKPTWLPRDRDADFGVCADLYKAGKIVATLEVEHGYGCVVYASSETGKFGDTTLCDQVTFEEAVAAAERLIEG